MGVCRDSGWRETRALEKECYQIALVEIEMYLSLRGFGEGDMLTP